MTRFPNVLPIGLLAVLATLFPTHAIAEKLNLDRITPVAATEQIPIVDFFRLPLMQYPKLNLAGTHVAAVVPAGEDHTNLLIFDLNTKKIEMLGTRGDSDIYEAAWLDNTHVVYGISVKKFASFILGAAEVGALYNTYPLLQNVGARIVAVPPKDRMHPVAQLMRETMNTGKYGEVVAVDAGFASGKFLDLSGAGGLLNMKQLDETTETNVHHITTRYPILETPGGFDLRYYADRDGHLAFGETATAGVHTLFQLVGEKWQKCPQDLDQIQVFGAGDQPGEIVELAARKDGKPRPLQFVNAANDAPGEVLFQDDHYDFDGWLYRDPVSQAIVGATFNRAGPEVVWFTEAYRNLQKAVDRHFPGFITRIMGTDEAGKMVLVNTYSDRQPPIYRWINLETHTEGSIQNTRPWLDPARMLPMSMTKFKTRDGRRLDAYVTMPKGVSKQNPPPLVVLPHDNSGSRDVWGFNDEVQFLASRGYAVLQPNYRGSAGTAWMFPEEDEWNFRKMHEDVTDATKALISAGLVDPNRVAIYGTGFSGYLALAGVALEPALYRCAIAVSPVVDWGKAITDGKYYEYSSPFYLRMKRKLGDPKRDPKKFEAMSPLFHAGEIQAAVLIAYGEYDDSNQIGLAKDLVGTVKRHQPSADTVSFVNEADGVHHLGHRLEFYSRMETFLAQHLSPNKPAGVAGTP
jgi:dienelactone hydrolase